MIRSTLPFNMTTLFLRLFCSASPEAIFEFLSRISNSFLWGVMIELSISSREIALIASASTTNGFFELFMYSFTKEAAFFPIPKDSFSASVHNSRKSSST